MKKLIILILFSFILSVLTSCSYDNTNNFRITTNVSYLELGDTYDVIIDNESYKTSNLDPSLPIIGVTSNGFTEVDINHSLVMICSQINCSSETKYYMFSSLDGSQSIRIYTHNDKQKFELGDRVNVFTNKRTLKCSKSI